MNLSDKNQIVAVIKSSSTQVHGVRHEWQRDDYNSHIRGGQGPMLSQGTPYAKMTIELYYLPGEVRKPGLASPVNPMLAEDPFHPNAVRDESTNSKVCPRCGDPGKLMMALVCADHGKFAVSNG